MASNSVQVLLLTLGLIGFGSVSAKEAAQFDDITPELQVKLQNAYEALGDDYVPRTEHINADGEPHYINRLVLEDSPYLLQHAHNPVNWYPWGEEAFAAARKANKPIFLSIGYATCHWCHVMERESFEDESIARILNDNYIAIKVDREQRPDVDSTYMTAVQMLTGSGGWPLSGFLNAKAQPFYGGTYFPPDAFSDLLTRVSTVWVDSRTELDEQAEKVSAALKTATSLSAKIRDVGQRDISAAVFDFVSSHDSLQGGFGDAPKFPREPTLEFLLDQTRQQVSSEILQVVDFTLQRIAAGGIHDHVGGGFHRYAVDADWLVPHFEKMLYNQAGLATVFADAWLITGNTEHLRTARRTLDYVLRDMTSPEGLFYSATDADSAGGEGEYFIWSEDELKQLLGDDDAAFAIKIWGVTPDGNFEHRNILHLEDTLTSAASEFDISLAELTAKVDAISSKLLSVRKTREAPIRDEKILTAWNGMMITTLARVGDMTNNQQYINAAITAADAIVSSNKRSDNRLWRSQFKGRWSVAASQADYAFLAEGLLALYDITANQRFLDKAESLVATMNTDFWDTTAAGYFLGEKLVGGAALPSRPKEIYDNSHPSGNSMAARVLVRLWRRTGNTQYHDRAMELFGAYSNNLSQGPSSFPYLLIALSELHNGESGFRQYAANGKVSVAARIKDEKLVVSVNIADGWHINAHQPLQDYLIGTVVSDAANEPLLDTHYPDAKLATLGFQRAELALYEGSVTFSSPLPDKRIAVVGNNLPISVSLQACNDKTCLAPETIILNVSMTDG